MIIYQVRKSTGVVNVYKAPATGGPFTLVDPVPGRAVHTYGTGALGYGAVSDPARQTALTVLFDFLNNGPQALARVPSFVTRFVSRWYSSSFIDDTTLNTFLAQQGLPQGAAVELKLIRYANFYEGTQDVSQTPWHLDADMGGMFAVVNAHSEAGTGTLNGQIQDADDGGGPWGAALAELVEMESGSTDNNFQLLTFVPSRRWVRLAIQLAGDDPQFFIATHFGLFPGTSWYIPVSIVP